MSRLSCRGSIALGAALVALFSSRAADAQDVVVQAPHRHHGGVVRDVFTGVWYDRANQADAEHRLPHRLAKLQRDAARGDSAAVDGDVLRIDRLNHRIVVDDWLIRENSCQNPGYYPYPVRLDPITYCAIAQYRCPPRPLGRP